MVFPGRIGGPMVLSLLKMWYHDLNMMDPWFSKYILDRIDGPMVFRLIKMWYHGLNMMDPWFSKCDTMFFQILFPPENHQLQNYAIFLLFVCIFSKNFSTLSKSFINYQNYIHHFQKNWPAYRPAKKPWVHKTMGPPINPEKTMGPWTHGYHETVGPHFTLFSTQKAPSGQKPHLKNSRDFSFRGVLLTPR